MKKNIVFAALALLLTATAFAQTEADFTVELTADSTGVVIKRYTGNVAAVKIPATIQGMPVREIGENAFFRNKIITSVVIPEGVTKIGRMAFFQNFYNEGHLSSVTLPEGLIEIGAQAFFSCPLTAITLPESLSALGSRAFSGERNPSKITAVTIPAGLTNIDEGAFAECNNLKTVIVSEGITEIPVRMFADCNALTTLTLPSTLTRIRTNAFYKTALTTVTIPETVEKIEFNGRDTASSPYLKYQG
jgi:hypothetical protein